MLTREERQALWVAAMKFGWDEFARFFGVDRRELELVAKGKFNPVVEDRIKSQWQIVLNVLFGERQVRRHDR